MNFIDTDKLTREIAAATVRCLSDLVSEIGDESQLYGFALYTVDGLAGINPSASAETGFQSRRNKLLNDNKQIGWLKKNNIDVDACLLGDYRWSVYEWEHECYGHTHFNNSSEMLSRAVQNLPDDVDDGFAILTVQALACFTVALTRLKTEPIFRGLEHKPILFCSKPSSADTTWLEYESARLCNNDEQFATLKRERLDWIHEDGDLDSECIPIYRETVESIQRNGGT